MSTGAVTSSQHKHAPPRPPPLLPQARCRKEGDADLQGDTRGAGQGRQQRSRADGVDEGRHDAAVEGGKLWGGGRGRRGGGGGKKACKARARCVIPPPISDLVAAPSVKLIEPLKPVHWRPSSRPPPPPQHPRVTSSGTPTEPKQGGHTLLQSRGDTVRRAVQRPEVKANECSAPSATWSKHWHGAASAASPKDSRARPGTCSDPSGPGHGASPDACAGGRRGVRATP